MPRYLVYADSLAADWHLDRTDLLRRVVQEWPDAAVINAENPGNTEMRDLGWKITQGESSIECWSAKSGMGIEVDGDDRLAVVVAAWYRNLVPRSIVVKFSDDMYAAHTEIPYGATAADVQRLYDEA